MNFYAKNKLLYGIFHPNYTYFYTYPLKRRRFNKKFTKINIFLFFSRKLYVIINLYITTNKFRMKVRPKKMKKLISVILIILALFSLSACKNEKNETSDGSGDNNNVLTDENASAQKKEIIRTTFCYNLSRRPAAVVLPKGYYELSEGKMDTEFLKAYVGKNGYFDNVVLGENASSYACAISYLLIDDVGTLSDVLSTTGKYTLGDIYPANILDNYFVIAIHRHSSSQSANGSRYTVEFDKESNTLNIKQEPYRAGYVHSNAQLVPAYALDLVPIERTVLNGVDLKNVKATFTVLEQILIEEETAPPTDGTSPSN